jgi:hypothetical protein
MTATAEKKFFYSYAPGLVISADKGKEQRMEGGNFKRVGEKIIQFQDNGEGYQDREGRHVPLGRYVTEDPAEIAFLTARMQNEKDVIDQKEYNRLVIPPEQREQQLQRTIDEQNKLIGDLQKNRK